MKQYCNIHLFIEIYCSRLGVVRPLTFSKKNIYGHSTKTQVKFSHGARFTLNPAGTCQTTLQRPRCNPSAFIRTSDLLNHPSDDLVALIASNEIYTFFCILLANNIYTAFRQKARNGMVLLLLPEHKKIRTKSCKPLILLGFLNFVLIITSSSLNG